MAQVLAQVLIQVDEIHLATFMVSMFFLSTPAPIDSYNFLASGLGRDSATAFPTLLILTPSSSHNGNDNANNQRCTNNDATIPDVANDVNQINLILFQ